MDGKPFPEVEHGKVKVELMEKAEARKHYGKGISTKELHQREKALLQYDGVERRQNPELWSIQFAGGHPDLLVKDSDPGNKHQSIYLDMVHLVTTLTIDCPRNPHRHFP